MDLTLDAQRKPAEMLSFFEIDSGMKVADLAAGGGYTTEALARTVGETGLVYGQNNEFILTRFAEKPWSERLTKSVMSKVRRVDREFESPLPEEAKDLDAAIMVLFYHDLVWFKTDRAKFNQSIFEALKPGGVFGIVDHSARPGDGLSVSKTLHRIEETVLIEEIEQAGFVLDGSADFLRHPEDPRDWSASPSTAGDKRGESDRFVLRFKKTLKQTAADDKLAASSPSVCDEPRPQNCESKGEVVCATVDTKIRCITAPCPSTELKNYANACQACADQLVQSYVPGACR